MFHEGFTRGQARCLGTINARAWMVAKSRGSDAEIRVEATRKFIDLATLSGHSPPTGTIGQVIYKPLTAKH